MELIRGHHNVGEANYHLQFTPKYRRDIFLDPVVRQVCAESFKETAGRLGVVLHALEFGPDHVHVFVGACKNYGAAEVARHLKGASSRRIRQECWERIKPKLWGEAFWTAGYFYRSVGSTTSQNIKHYIEQSQSRHWKATTPEAYREKAQKTLNQYLTQNPAGFSPR